MAAKIYGYTSLTGGGVAALDSIDGSILNVGDLAYGTDGNETYSMILDGSGDAESSPDCIAPDSNAGVKRWKRRHDEAKAYRAAAPTNGHMASLDADGDLVDSGKIAANVIEKTVATPSTGDSLIYNGSLWAPSSYNRKNALINGNFVGWQRGVSFTSATTPANSDDTYLPDRWVLLSDGNDIVDVTRSTTVPTTGFKYSAALDVETANKKFGILQIIENIDCQHLIGNIVVFSFYAKVSATTKLDNLKAAIISWSSTADVVTSDVVSSWNNENTNPTLAANWTFENTPSNLSPTTSFARYSVSATIDTASTTNVAVMIWSDVTDTTAGDFLYITGCQLEVGSIPTNYEFRPIAEEATLWLRFYQKFTTQELFGRGTATTSLVVTVHTPVELRTSPILAITSSPIKYDGTTPTGTPTITVASVTSTILRLDFTNLTGVTDNAAYWCNTSSLTLDAEL